MLRRYSGYGNARPGVLMVATSVPVLGVSPGAGATGAAVCGAGSLSLSAGGGLGAGAGAVFTGLASLGVTGAGLSFGGAGFGGVGAGFSSGGGVGNASRASRCFVVGAGAATRSTAYEGGEARVGFTAAARKKTTAA